MNRNALIFTFVTICAVVLIVALIPTRPRTDINAPLPPSPVNWSIVQDDTNNTLTISWLGIPGYEAARPGSWIQQMLEERFNIRLDTIFMDLNAFAKRRPLILCGGQAPDVMWDGFPTSVRNNIENRFIMSVPYSVILQHAPTYVSLLNRYGKEAWLYSYYRGENFGLPTFIEGANRPRVGCWRKDWLDAVGITKVPDTVESMHEALRRFRYNDPDGNGKKDTYGWNPYIGHWSLAFSELFAAYDLLAFDFVERDGKITWGGILPECREALATLRRWYEEELLDPDFVVDSQQNQVTERKFQNGRAGYLFPLDFYTAYDTSDPASMSGILQALNPNAKIIPAPLLKNRDGQPRGQAWGGAAHVLQFGRQLEQQPEKVIRVLEMIEAITKDKTLYLESTSGREGLHWTKQAGAGIELLPPWNTDKQLRGAQMLAPGGFGCMFFYPAGLDYTYQTAYRDPAYLRFEDTFKKPEWGLSNPLGKSEVVPSAGRYLNDLRNFQMTVFVEMVIGKRPIASFDEYVTEWKQRGGAVLLQEANDMYETMQQIFNQVGAGETRND